MPTRTRRRTLRKHRGRVPVITTPVSAAPISEATPMLDDLHVDVIDVEQAVVAEFPEVQLGDPAALTLAEAAARADTVRFEVRYALTANSVIAQTTAVSNQMIRHVGWSTIYDYATEGTTRMATNTFDTNTAYYLNTAATNVWTAWNGTGTAASSSSVTQIWADWQTSAGTTTLPVYRPPARREPTPEEIAAIEERQRRWDAEQAERARVQAEADVRARALLLDVLTDEQREEFVATERFRVRGSKGGVYEVRCNSGVSGNVRGRPHMGGRERSYCIHPTNGVPRHDTYLAQKLLLEHDEDEFLRVANAS